MSARGPDASGLLARDQVAFGHRRLAIIDTSRRAEQPLVDAHLGLSLVFNGAIYNHRELRAELEEQGYRFFSDGDTEVILKAYHAWGEDFVERLQGMFAFAIWERDAQRLVLGRDPLGIKPLYYAQQGDVFRFASTLPALLEAGDVGTELDAVALQHYLSFHSVVPAPRTILRDVRKLAPGSMLTIDADGRRRERRYWRLQIPEEVESAEPEEWVERLRDALRTAVGHRLVADVPVGVLLSGGLDSSLVVALLAEQGDSPETFSIGFEAVNGEPGDEFEYSDLIAERFGTKHHRIPIAGQRALDALPGCVAAMSEPMVSHDAIGFYLLSEAVSQHVKVVQSGQGADEVFAGYHWYPKLMEAEDAVADYHRVFADRDQRELERVVHPRFHGRDHATEFLEAHFDSVESPRPIDKALHVDTTVMLVDDPVKRVDNMTMAFGLEARVPFLDRQLVELAARIPAELKLAEGGKGILKQAARGIVPDAVIDRPKGYFPVPELKYLRGRHLDFVREVLHSTAARERELFRPDYVEELLEHPDEHITPLRGSKLWQVALLECWLQSHCL